jgi:hypothetical protein
VKPDRDMLVLMGILAIVGMAAAALCVAFIIFYIAWRIWSGIGLRSELLFLLRYFVPPALILLIGGWFLLRHIRAQWKAPTGPAS